MSDLDKLTALLTEFGVEFKTEKSVEGKPEVFCREGDSKVRGFGGFYTVFTFDDNGKFEEMGSWE